MAAAGNRAHGAIDVHAVVLAAFVAVEQRRDGLERQRRGKEQRIARERGEDQLAELASDGRKLGKLAVALGQGALLAHGGLAVGPLGGVEQAAAFRHLFGRQHLGHMDHHARMLAHRNGQNEKFTVSSADMGVPGM